MNRCGPATSAAPRTWLDRPPPSLHSGAGATPSGPRCSACGLVPRTCAPCVVPPRPSARERDSSGLHSAGSPAARWTRLRGLVLLPSPESLRWKACRSETCGPSLHLRTGRHACVQRNTVRKPEIPIQLARFSTVQCEVCALFEHSALRRP